MNFDVWLEILKALVAALILLYLWRVGRRERLYRQKGWKRILLGFFLLLFASLLDITDNFPTLNQYVVIGDTPTEIFLEEIIGYLAGFILIFFGFTQWFPLIERLQQTEAELRDKATELETTVEIRTASLQQKTEQLGQELKLRAQAEELRHQQEESFQAVLEGAPDAVFITAADGQIEYVNGRTTRLLGFTHAELLDRTVFDLVPPDWRDRYRQVFLSIPTNQHTLVSEIRLIRKDGQKIPLEMNVTILPDGRLYGSCRDISERKQAEAALIESEARFRQMFERHNASMLLIEPSSGKIVDANAAASRFYGYSVERMKTLNISEINVLAPEDIPAERTPAVDTERNYSIFTHRLANGALRTVEAHSSPVGVGGQTLLFSIIHDVTARKQAEEQVHQLAFYDPLTRLPNRRLLLDRLQQIMTAGSRSAKHGALLFLDLDNFKTLNDTKGHDVGDQMLIQVAHRLQSCVRKSDTVARLGGDEFVVVLGSLSSVADEAATQAKLVAEKIRVALSQPYFLPDYEHRTTTSIGVCLFRGHLESAENLFKYADNAMYQAKAAGRNTVRFYNPDMQAALEARTALETELEQAFDQQQFRLYYQIQIDSAHRTTGAEVLLRWEHPELGVVPPANFIPLAENSGLIIPIGMWAIETACTQLAAWQHDESMRNLQLTVNVSAKQFREADFVAQIQRVLSKTRAQPSQLKLELTETTVLEDIEDTIAKMTALKREGISFSIDDFGTGYSSLTYLRRLPLDQIKIDRSFVNDITTDSNDAAIVQAILAMTKALGLNVIAEGVETAEQQALLEQYGCHEFQGYLYSRPITLEEFEELTRHAV